jgi:hypothetical protein
VEIRSADGRLVMSEQLFSQRGQLSIGTLAHGSYSLIFHTLEGALDRTHFVKY